MTSSLRNTSTLLTLMALLLTALAASPPVPARVLKMAYDADPVSLDPHEQLSGGTLQLSHLLFDPLVRWNQQQQIEARLAQSWKRIDDRTLRFTLRKNIVFHSGNPLTTADVVFTFNRLKESTDFKGLFEPFESIRAISDTEFDLITTKPYALVLNLATYIFPMDHKFYTGKDERGRDKAAIIKNGDSFASRQASGTGPFRLTARQQGVRLEFKRSENYWDQNKGNVSEIIFTPIKEGPTRVAALLSGDVDFISPVPPVDMKRIENNPKVNLVTLSGSRIITLQLNQKRRPEFQNKKVRQAMVYAVNNVGIVQKIMKGFGTPAAQLSPKGYPGHDPALVPRYDLDKARALMKAAGYEKGFRVSMMTPNNRYVNDFKIAQAVVSMLARINITVDLKALPKAQYWPEFDKRAADIMMIGWHSDTEDTANFFEYLLMTPDSKTGYGQYNSGNYSNPVLDTLVLKANTESDPEKRQNLLRQMEHMIYEDAPFIPLHWQDLAWASKQGVHIENVVNIMNFPYLGDLTVD